jgi:hypothetical protein
VAVEEIPLTTGPGGSPAAMAMPSSSSPAEPSPPGRSIAKSILYANIDVEVARRALRHYAPDILSFRSTADR